MSELIEIVIVEDLPSDVELVRHELNRAGYRFNLRQVETGEQLTQALDTILPDLVLTDYSLPHFTGMDTIRIVRERMPSTPIIVITGSIDEEVAVDCILAGADDYVIKQHLTRLIPSIRQAQERHKMAVEKRRAESQLLYSRDMLALALMSTNAGMWEVDLTTQQAAYSPSWARLLGYSLSEIMHDPYFWREVVHPDDMQEIFSDFTKHITEKTAFYENRHRARRKDGEWIWVLGRGKMVTWDTNGNPTKMVGTITDITGLIRAEEELRERTRRLDLLNQAAQKLNESLDPVKIYETIYECVSSAMDCSGLYVSSFDPNTKQIRCVAACQDGSWLNVTEFPPIPLEPEGKGTQSVVIHTKQSMKIDDYPAHLKTATKANYVDGEGNLVDSVPEDADVTHSALIVPMFMEGKVTGVIQVFSYRQGIYTDENLKLVEALAQHVSLALRNVQLYSEALFEIANRKTAEQNLAVQFSTLQSILESSNDSLYSLDREYRYTSFNRAHVERMKTRFHCEPQINHGIFEGFTDDALIEQIKGFIAEAFRGKQSTRGYAAKQLSQTFYYEMSLNPIFNLSREVIGVSVFTRDITGRKQTEREFEMLYSVTNAIQESWSFEAALVKTITEFCLATGWALGEAWIPVDQEHLRNVPCYYDPDLPLLASFSELSDKISIVPGVGLPGTTWIRRAPVWIQDILTENADTFKRQEIAGECGLRAGFGVPVMVGPEVVAILCFFMYDARPADHHLLDLVNSITQQLSEFYQKKLAEETMRESEQQYRMLFQQNPLPMWIYDFESQKFLAANTVAIEKYGFSGSELLEMTVWDIFPKEDLPRLEKIIEDSSREHVFIPDLRHQLKDGSIIDVDIISNNIDFSGKKARLAIAFDVTERKRTEAERLRLFTAVEQVSESLVITDVFGKILYVNPYFEKVTGYTHDEALGQNPRMLKSGQHDVSFYKAMWAELSSGKIWQGQIVNRRKDGSFFTEEATITPAFNQSGEVTNYIAVKRDLTRERHLEEQLHQSQKLEAIGRLAGGVAHDFNNLLTVVNSNAELMATEIEQGSPLLEGLKTIQEMVDRGSALTRQLLAFSRRQVQEMKVVSLNQICQGITRLLRRLIREDIELIFDLTEEPTTIKADSGQIEQVLMNLVVNARDAMTSGGTICITTQRSTRSPVVDGGKGERIVRLLVADTGSGMTKEVKERVLEPFFTTKPVGKGTGLGLSTVHGIVTQTGGSIAIESEVNKGTTFAIEFPFHDEVIEEIAVLEKPKSLRGKETILLVDDETMIQEMVKRILELKGYVVHTADNGQKALDRFAQLNGKIDLLVTDVVMPHMGGARLVEELRKIQPSLKTLFISGYTTEESVHQIQDMGIPLLYKPFGSRDLIEAVRKILDSHS